MANFADKYSQILDEMESVDEVVEELDEEDESQEKLAKKFIDFAAEHDVYKFQKYNELLIKEGYTDKDERYEIISILIG